MRLGRYLSSLTKSELEGLREQLNLTDDEEIVYKLLAAGKSNTYVSTKCCIAISTVANRTKAIKRKIEKVRVECDTKSVVEFCDR